MHGHQIDWKNCGACGNQCTIYWPSCCNGVCTDTIYDNDNCGTCGNKYLHTGFGSHLEIILGSTVRKEVFDASHHPNFPLVELSKYAQTWILVQTIALRACDKGICSRDTQTDPNNCGRCYIARAPLRAKADNVSDCRAYWSCVVGDVSISKW